MQKQAFAHDSPCTLLTPSASVAAVRIYENKFSCMTHLAHFCYFCTLRVHIARLSPIFKKDENHPFISLFLEMGRRWATRRLGSARRSV